MIMTLEKVIVLIFQVIRTNALTKCVISHKLRHMTYKKSEIDHALAGNNDTQAKSNNHGTNYASVIVESF